MSDKIGDTESAQRVIDAYAHDPEGLTREECEALTESREQADVLCSALGWGAKGEITAEEKASLEAAGFAAEFVQDIAGNDGNAALRERAKWLGDHVVRKYWQRDYKNKIREGFVRELGDMGPVAESAVSALITQLKRGNPDAAEALGKIGPATPEVISALIAAFEDGDDEVRRSSAEALGKVGPDDSDFTADDIAALDKMRDETNKRRRVFLHDTGLKLAGGVRFKVSETAVSVDNSDGLFTIDRDYLPIIYLLDGLDLLYGIKILGAPDEINKYVGQTQIERDDKLKDKDPEINIAVVTLSAKRVGDNYIVTLWNWLEDAPFLVRKYPADARENFYRVAGRELEMAARDYLDKFDERKALDALKKSAETGTLTGALLYDVGNPEGWSKDDVDDAHDALKELAGDFEIEIMATPFSAEQDRDSSILMWLYDKPSFDLTKRQIRKIGKRGIEIRGFMEGISLTISDKDNQYKMGARLEKEGYFDNPDKLYMKDKHGNMIYPILARNKINEKPICEGFYVEVPYNLSGAAEEGKARVVGFDLTGFGYGDYPRLFSNAALAPVKAPSEETPYRLYSTLDPSRDQKTGNTFERVSGLAAEAEELFGFQPGDRISDIIYIPAQHENASVRFANPNSFFVWDEMLPEIEKGTRDFVVFHEICHNMDGLFNISSHPAFNGVYEKLTNAQDLDLFADINESDFLGMKMGGHSLDNRLEFFASLMNTIKAPDWEDRLFRMTGNGLGLVMDERIRGIYYHALKALRAALADRLPNAKDAPIFKLLEARIEYMEFLRADGTGKRSAYASLDRLVFPTIEEMLNKGQDPVTVITAKDYEKEVLNSKEPVLVYVYNDTFNKRENVHFIRELKEKIGDKIKFVVITTTDAAPFFTKVECFPTLDSQLYLIEDRRIIYNPDSNYDVDHIDDDLTNIMAKKDKRKRA